MPSVHDVAKYLLEEYGSMETMKLQKLAYYANAYHCAWERDPMFPERVEAWLHGPVIRELFYQHQGKIQVSAEDLQRGDAGALDTADIEVIDSVWEALGSLTGYQLRTRTHQESPWIDAYVESERYHNREITYEVMQEYYNSN